MLSTLSQQLIKSPHTWWSRNKWWLTRYIISARQIFYRCENISRVHFQSTDLLSLGLAVSETNHSLLTNIMSTTLIWLLYSGWSKNFICKYIKINRLLWMQVAVQWYIFSSTYLAATTLHHIHAKKKKMSVTQFNNCVQIHKLKAWDSAMEDE